MKYIDKSKIKIKELQFKKDVLVLGIESSCDETSISVVKNGRIVLSNVISSQIDIHRRFGGVVPEVASRNHIMAIPNVYKKALEDANVSIDDIDAIAVTYGAGLIGALMIGVNFAKSLAFKFDKPLIAVNHIKGHIGANYIAHNELVPPYMCLVVSGGHTAIIRVDDYIHHTYIGGTVDDAIGEAYDKVARCLGLSYPGGPVIDRLAKVGQPNIILTKHNNLKDTYNFSYSGLKTATINYIHNAQQKNEQVNIENVCASFQSTAVSELVEKTIRATREYNLDKIVLAGGVAANSYLREQMTINAKEFGISVFYPDYKMCTDNAAMIAAAGYFNLMNNEGIADLSLTPVSSIKLD